MYTSIVNIHCKECNSDDIVDDHSTGDSVCRECGLVVDKIIHADWNTMNHTSFYPSNHDTTIRKFCEDNQLGQNTLNSTLEYIRMNKVDKSELTSIIYAIHSIETNTTIHPLVKKRKKDTDDIIEKMNDILQKYRIHTQEPEQTLTNQENEWIHSLYDEIIQKTENVPKRVLIQIRNEIESFIKTRPEALFYNSSVLSTVLLLKHKIPVEHKLPSSKIRKITKELFV